MEQLLKIQDLTIQLKQKKKNLNVLSNVSLSVKKGEIFGIVGESGSGKSVLTNSIIGLQPDNMIISDGDILFEEESIIRKSKKEIQNIRGNDISIIFQNPMTSLNPSKTIGNQIIEVIRRHNKISKQEARKLAIEVIQKVGLPRAEQLLNDYPHQLSGGMQQRIMIAIAIVCQPKLLIADEPTTALDVTIQAQILKLLKDIRDSHKMTILLISHDLGLIGEVCDRIAVLYAGEVVEVGNKEEVLKNPQHPYTKGLINSIPTPNKKGLPLYSITGTVPPLHERIQGCPFANRCEFAFDKCFTTKPQKEKIDENHEVSCFLSQLDCQGSEQKYEAIVT